MELLDAACEAITLGRKLLPRGPAPAWAAGARILSSDNASAIERLLSAMNTWSGDEQGDMLRAWAGNFQEHAAAQRLLERYGFRAKI